MSALREYIARRYFEKKGLRVEPDEILITNGSQQCLDLIGKIFLDKGDHVVIERPGYLGAIQAFSMYEPVFYPVPLLDDGIDAELLRETFLENQIKLFYSVPNFQNPSGITYSKQKRIEVADILKNHDAIFVEDDPYGELRFMGEDMPSQRILYQYLIDNDIEKHIFRIRQAYKKQRDVMVSSIEEYFPSEIKYTKPEGGMFLWITLPERILSLDLFNRAIKENVAFVPGSPFYVGAGGENTLRLNFSNSDEERIEEGIKRLAKIIEKYG